MNVQRARQAALAQFQGIYRQTRASDRIWVAVRIASKTQSSSGMRNLREENEQPFDAQTDSCASALVKFPKTLYGNQSSAEIEGFKPKVDPALVTFLENKIGIRAVYGLTEAEVPTEIRLNTAQDQ